MYVIEARNVHQALCIGLDVLGRFGVREESRNGGVLVSPVPVTSVYEQPTERVLFHPLRDANPFFHLMEGLWMLAGRNDVAWIGQFNATFNRYSDDGQTFHGAYGHRWNGHWDFPQLEKVVQLFRNHPKTRRAVIGMWDPQADLWETEGDHKDIPCNTHVYVWVDKEGSLCITVCCRSNDIIWGAYGANAVHFSMLHEYLAAKIGRPVGRMYQISNNFHAYEELFNKLHPLAQEWRLTGNPYLGVKLETVPHTVPPPPVEPLPMVSDPAAWDADLAHFMEDGNADRVRMYREPWFALVAEPMRRAYLHFKDKEDPLRFRKALTYLDTVRATDWRRAGTEWIQRREEAFNAKQG